MIATSLTADAEIRRLRKLGEATHDWCEPVPHPTPSAQPAGATLFAAFAAMRNMVMRSSRPRIAAPVPAPEGGAR